MMSSKSWDVVLAFPVVLATERRYAEEARAEKETAARDAGKSVSYSISDAGKCYMVMERVRIARYRGMTAQSKAYRKLAELKEQLMADDSVEVVAEAVA